MNCATSSSHGGEDRPALSLVWNIRNYGDGRRDARPRQRPFARCRGQSTSTFFWASYLSYSTTATTTVASVDMLISLVPHICPAWQDEDHQWQLLLRKSTAKLRYAAGADGAEEHLGLDVVQVRSCFFRIKQKVRTYILLCVYHTSTVLRNEAHVFMTIAILFCLHCFIAHPQDSANSFAPPR